MILGDYAAALRRGEEGDAGRFDEILEIFFGVPPQHAAAG
jgi:hypothetical protein